MKRTYTVLLLAILAVPLFAFANERIFVQVPAMIDPSAPIPYAVRTDCALDMLLGNYTLSAIGQRDGMVQPIKEAEQAGADKVVQLTIISAHGFGGGAWSGSKSMTVRADIKKDGTIISSSVFSRHSRGGAFGGFYGTCAILDRVASVLGKDIADWVSRGGSARPRESSPNATEQAKALEPTASHAKDNKDGELKQ